MTRRVFFFFFSLLLRGAVPTDFSAYRLPQLHSSDNIFAYLMHSTRFPVAAGISFQDYNHRETCHLLPVEPCAL